MEEREVDYFRERVMSNKRYASSQQVTTMGCASSTHFSHSDSPTLLEVWGLDDPAATDQAVQDAVGLAVATSVVSTQTKTARAVVPTEVATVVQDSCWGGRVTGT